MRTSLQDTTILYANLPLLTCIYGALWTPFFLFDATVKAEAFDLGMVRAVLMEYYGFAAPPVHCGLTLVSFLGAYLRHSLGAPLKRMITWHHSVPILREFARLLLPPMFFCLSEVTSDTVQEIPRDC